MSATLLRNFKDVDIIYGESNIILRLGDDHINLSNRHMIHRHVTASTAENVLDSLRGGHFIVEKGRIGEVSLKEYKDNRYTGFMQSDDFINRFSNDKELSTRLQDRIDISQYGQGGLFNIAAGFTWSGFSPNLKTQVNLTRDICQNVMTMQSSIIQKQVPILNLFDTHMDIAAEQVMCTASRIVKERMGQIHHEVASVRDVGLVYKHIEERLKEDEDNSRLLNIARVIEDGNLEEYYQKSAFDNSAIGSSVASHLCRFDLLNMATEISSHTNETPRSSNRALNRIASMLLLQDDGVFLNGNVLVPRIFKNPEEAFHG